MAILVDVLESKELPPCFTGGVPSIDWIAEFHVGNDVNRQQISTSPNFLYSATSDPLLLFDQTNYYVSIVANTANDPVRWNWYARDFPQGASRFDRTADGVAWSGNGFRNYNFSLYGELAAVPEPVTIDIKPGSDTNCMNINGHGVIPVATFGSADFNVEHIDQTTLSFAGLDVRETKKGKLLCHLEDINIDGYWDLICQFEDDTEKWMPDSDTEATLTGNLLELFEGTAFKGTDSICLRPGKDEPEAPIESQRPTEEDNLNPLPWW